MIERFRSYLLLLARMQIDPRQPMRIEASDIVQQTLLEAHQAVHTFTGDESGLAAWLRNILANNIRDAFRRQQRQKRDARREVSLHEDLSRSEVRLAACLADSGQKPSQHAVRNEELMESGRVFNKGLRWKE